MNITFAPRPRITFVTETTTDGKVRAVTLGSETKADDVPNLRLTRDGLICVPEDHSERSVK